MDVVNNNTVMFGETVTEERERERESYGSKRSTVVKPKGTSVKK